ncbi:hypothetical protein V496_01452 [Pseudogymnoascus sp. VKM F-4515 (FW-2607)]|nr:hypothetical protein V496_01452 [Pseudogymnoascus sp. VKM F-4515 (FW-2607)]
MLKPLPLLRGEITYSTAEAEEVNILHRLRYPAEKVKFFNHIDNKRNWIKTVVTHHLKLKSPALCQVADVENWYHGSFNVCIPVTISPWEGKEQPGQRVLIRFPLPYRVGEVFRPGNGDEKIRCEAGTYAYLQENCPEIPIPRLYGFATSDGETFSRLQNLPFLARCFQYLRRQLLSWLGRPLPTLYVRHDVGSQISGDEGVGAGYLLIEHIEDAQGEMLSNSWDKKRDDIRLRNALFRDLSRIMLSMARAPLPKIGSFMIDRHGFLRLSNRPLTVEIFEMENEEIPTDIPRDCTYSTADSYAMSIIGIHDNRLLHQPNAIKDADDYIYQTSALTTMRTVLPTFFKRECRHGPFIFTLTDLHQSNIFVDENWNITSLVDLEWASTRPLEMLRTPTWLTSKACDEIAEEGQEEYDKIREEYMCSFTAEEEQAQSCASSNDDGKLRLSAVMKQNWDKGIFWYTLALASPTGIFRLFYKQIQPRFIMHNKDHDNFKLIMPWYWAEDYVRIWPKKMSDREDYDIRLRHAFEANALPDTIPNI